MFDEAFGEITEAKRSRSWQAITDCLNEHTNAANDGNDRQNNVQAGEKSLEPGKTAYARPA